jgi:ferrochelatase
VKITSVVDIVGGQLQNTPSISFFTQSHTKLKRVKDGDLFISSSLADIKQAISQGAFGIIYDFDLDIDTLDSEIAWIKVDSIPNAITKLLRFSLSNKRFNCFSVDTVSYELLKIFYPNKKEILFLKNDVQKDFELLNNIDSELIIISTNQKFLNDIYPTAKTFLIKNYPLKNLTIHSMFETTFSYKDKFFSKLKLSKLYIDHLLNVLEFCHIESLDANKLKSFSFMQPIFINLDNEIVDYGRSNKFILTNQNKTIANQEIEFLYDNFSYGKVYILDGTNLSTNNIYHIIKTKQYNCLYIKGKTPNQILEILEFNKKQETTLFK